MRHAPVFHRRLTSTALFLLTLLLAPAAAVAQSAAGLGTIDFETSGAPEAQEAFERGVLLLHSFEYADARTAFREARTIDPDFAMAYWGEAMTHNHPLWYQQDAESARSALEALAPTPEERRAHAQLDVEKGFLAAAEVLYGEGSKQERDQAYRAAMATLHERFPENDEVATFYALSILGSVPERDFRTYMQAASVAEEVFMRNPNHPGAVHYLIHSYDDPIHAPLGLRAARRYARIAPAASHAQHMISHIYTALGEWDEVVTANELAVSVSEDRLRRLERPVEYRSKHALLWLMYGLLQQGRLDEARDKLGVMDADARAQPSRGQAWHHAAMRAAYVVEDPLTDTFPASVEQSDALSGVALDLFATGFRAAARQDLGGIRAALGPLRAAIAETRLTDPEDGKNAYDGATSADDRLVASIMARELEALFAFQRGKTQKAIGLAHEAAEDAASRALEYGPPSIPKPPHELLGEMLLVTGQPDAAAAAFEASLERNTGRTLSLVGLAAAAEMSGQERKARRAREELGSRTTPAAAEERPWLGSH